MNMHEIFSPSQALSSGAPALAWPSWLRQLSTNFALWPQKCAGNYGAAAVAMLLMMLAVVGILFPSLMLGDLTLTTARNGKAPQVAQQAIERL